MPPESLLVEGASLSNYLPLLKAYGIIVVALILGVVGTIYKLALLQSVSPEADSSSQESRINCPSCGARTTLDPRSCDYCDAALPRRSQSQ